MTALAAAALGLFAVAARGEGNKVFTVDDFLGIYWVSEPQLSPDGKLVAMTVTTKSLKDNGAASAIWVDHVYENTAAQKFTSGDKKDFSPRFSPDGKTLAFLSTRSGPPQIWAIPVGGGEAARVTAFPTGVSAFAWSPDGKQLLFSSDIWYACGADLKCQAKKAKEDEEGGGKVIDDLPFRMWNAWRAGLRSHLFLVSADGKGTPKDLTPFDRDVPPLDLGSSHDFVWSPDGKLVAFAMNDTDGDAWNTQNDVFLLDPRADGAKPVKVSAGEGNDSSPLFSPDGKHLAYLSMERPGFEADRKRLVLYDLAGKTSRLPETKGAAGGAGGAKASDLTIFDFAWAPDSKGVYLYTPQEGRRAVYRMTLEGKLTKLYGEGYNTDLMATGDGRSLVFLHETSRIAPNVYRIDDPAGKKPAAPARVTWFNDTLLGAFELGALEEFWFEGAKGDKVHAFLMKPPGFDPGRKYPAIFLLHGGPQGDWSDDFHPRWNTQLWAAPGYVVVMVNFHGSVGYGQQFCDDVSQHWGDYPFEDVMKGVDAALKSYPFIDPDRLGAGGASYGGYLADWIITHTGRFKAVFTHSGVFDLKSDYGSTEELWFPEWEFGGTPWQKPGLYEKFSPSSFVGDLEKYKTPTLVSHGANDFRVAVDQGMQLFTILQRMGIESKFLYFPGADHFVKKPKDVKLFYDTAIGWMDKYLKGDKGEKK